MYNQECTNGHKIRSRDLVNDIIQYSECDRGKERGLFFPIQLPRKYAKLFSQLKRENAIGIDKKEVNAKIFVEILNDAKSNIYFKEIIFLLYVACVKSPDIDHYENWLTDMVLAINEVNLPSEPNMLDLNSVLQDCLVNFNLRRVSMRITSVATFVVVTSNLLQKIKNYSTLLLSVEDKIKLVACLDDDILSEYHVVIQKWLNNTIVIADEAKLTKLINNTYFQNICDPFTTEIDYAIFTIKNHVSNMDGLNSIEKFNNGEAIIVTMLGQPIFKNGIQVIGKNTKAYIQNEHEKKIEQSAFFCGSSFSEDTNVTLFRTRQLETRQQLNVGFIFSHDSLHIKSGLVSDAFTFDDPDLPPLHLRNGHTVYVSVKGDYLTRNKAYKNGQLRESSSIPMVVNKHILKHGLDNQKDINLGSITTSELNFLPKGNDFFATVDGIIVDLSRQYPLPLNIAEFENWGTILELSNSLDKSIYLLYKEDNGKLRLKPYLELYPVADEATQDSSSISLTIPSHIFNPLQGFFKLTSYTEEYPGLNGVKRHTEKVIKVFDRYFSAKFFDETGFTCRFMRNLLSVHDVGKGLSSNTHMQHANTKDIIKQYKDEISLGYVEVKIISAIIEHDAIGQLLQNKTDVSQSSIILYNSFLKIKQYIPMFTNGRFWRIIMIFYICDASTYTRLRVRILDDQLAFKPKYQEKINLLHNEFNNKVATNEKMTEIRYYHDDHLLFRDFSSWLNKQKDKFPIDAVAVFDVDGTIVDYGKNDIRTKRNMIEIIKQLHSNGVKIILLTNRPSKQFVNDESVLRDQFAEEKIEIAGFFHNNNRGDDFRYYKRGILENYKEQIVCTFGDNKNDLHRHHFDSTYSPIFKSRSFWVNHSVQQF